MNEVFAAVNMVDLAVGLVMIAVGLVAVCVIFVAYRFVLNALGDNGPWYDEHGTEYYYTHGEPGGRYKDRL